MSRLRADRITLAYDGDPVVVDLDIEIPDGCITAIVGPNACGKSTLLRALARLLRPKTGAVYLDGEVIHKQPTRDAARQLGLLPQGPTAPEGLTVEDLVARGRFPHQRWFEQWSEDDVVAVARALTLTDMMPLRERRVEELSGGQRQRAWIAMALAQDTPIMLLDEPTTFLDVAHRLDVLDLLANLNEKQSRTIVIVLHDLNEACRYAHHVVAMKDGCIVGEGSPGEIVTESLVENVFGVRCRIVADPITGTPLYVPHARASSSRLVSGLSDSGSEDEPLLRERQLPTRP
ncbi:MAG: ABC transporter ATP-binding protein [Actinomycetota bacterium]